MRVSYDENRPFMWIDNGHHLLSMCNFLIATGRGTRDIDDMHLYYISEAINKANKHLRFWIHSQRNVNNQHENTKNFNRLDAYSHVQNWVTDCPK